MAPHQAALLPSSGMALIRRARSMHDNALQSIGMAIIRGDYPVGSLLPPKEELIAQLDVSQTTLREALQTLTAKGMVVARAKVGTRVLAESHWNMFDADILGWHLEKGIEPSFLAMLFEFRQTFEPTAAALMALRATADDMARLRDIAQQLQDAPDEKQAFVSVDIAFHQLIVEVSRNPFMQSLGALINTALIAAFMLSAPTAHPELSSLVRRQHLDVAEAIMRRDPQRASEAMEQVIQQGWKSYSGLDTIPVANLDVMSFMPL